MKSLLYSRSSRLVVAAIASVGLSGSLGSGVAAAAKSATAVEKRAEARTKADGKRPYTRGAGRKVG